MELPMEFFPFSVDTDVFKPSDYPRSPKVLLAGTCIDSIYLYRMRAKEYLLKDNLIDAYNSKLQALGINEQYEFTPFEEKV